MLSKGSVKSYAQIWFGSSRNLFQGAGSRPLVTFQRTGRKGSRAAVRRSPCPWRFVTWLLSAHGLVLLQGFQMFHIHVLLAAPEGLGDVLYPADRYTGQVHLDEGFFHTALPAAVTLDDGCLEGNTFQPGHMKGHVPGGGSQLSVIVAASITLSIKKVRF